MIKVSLKLILGYFDALCLVGFPYRNRDENQRFLTFSKQKYRKN